LQYLSIDVVLGSVGSSILSMKVLNANLPACYWLILPLCVWIIYTSDHLLDSLKIKRKLKMDRHYFHLLHKRTIFLFLILAIVFTMVLIYYLEKYMILFGLSISILIFAYIFSNHYIKHIFKFFPREIIIAIGYIAGTWGIPLLSKYPLINLSNLLYLFDHFLIIISIPLIYSIYEHGEDFIDGFISFSIIYGIKVTQILVFFFLTISFLLSLFLFMWYNIKISLIITFMSINLIAVVIFRNKLSYNERYRTLSDTLSFLPFCLLI
jgi:4-hydroxybenzoate polyprenyltransferase